MNGKNHTLRKKNLYNLTLKTASMYITNYILNNKYFP